MATYSTGFVSSAVAVVIFAVTPFGPTWTNASIGIITVTSDGSPVKAAWVAKTQAIVGQTIPVTIFVLKINGAATAIWRVNKTITVIVAIITNFPGIRMNQPVPVITVTTLSRSITSAGCAKAFEVQIIAKTIIVPVHVVRCATLGVFVISLAITVVINAISTKFRLARIYRWVCIITISRQHRGIFGRYIRQCKALEVCSNPPSVAIVVEIVIATPLTTRLISFAIAVVINAVPTNFGYSWVHHRIIVVAITRSLD